MIRGWIDAGDSTARVRLTLAGPLASHDLTFVLDTGFFGAILLPFEWAALMTQEFDANLRRIYLADGTPSPARTCTLDVAWIDGQQPVETLAIERPISSPGSIPPVEPYALPNARSVKPNGLIGRGLLANARLSISWIDGEVSITP